mmetsp:Transcript_27568/g.72671  ORF Transcript_27568/g.72671 Transcript_27568/m.72671 type:complete len:94 (-) Transcript_27568:102-383(-)
MFCEYGERGWQASDSSISPRVEPHLDVQFAMGRHPARISSEHPVCTTVHFVWSSHSAFPAPSVHRCIYSSSWFSFVRSFVLILSGARSSCDIP